MTYNYVSVMGNCILGDQSGEVVNVTVTPVTPTYFLTSANTELNIQAVTATSDSSGTWTASDIIDPTADESGILWNLVVTDKTSGQLIYSQTVTIAKANGDSQQWLSLT